MKEINDYEGDYCKWKQWVWRKEWGEELSSGSLANWAHTDLINKNKMEVFMGS